MSRTIAILMTIGIGVSLAALVAAQGQSTGSTGTSLQGATKARGTVSVLQGSSPSQLPAEPGYVLPTGPALQPPLPAEDNSSSYVLPETPAAAGGSLTAPPAEFQHVATPLPSTSSPDAADISLESVPPRLPVRPAPSLTPATEYEPIRSLPPGSLEEAIGNNGLNTARTPDTTPAAAVTAVSHVPDIVVETLGPSLLQVGRGSRWEVRVSNRDNRSSGPVFLRTELPAWMELATSQVSAGEVDRGELQGESRSITWQLPGLAAGEVKTWAMTLVPQQNKSFDFRIQWSLRPAVLSTAIRVVQPQLHLDIDGPAEMVLGQTRLYTIRLSNPGNGMARDVAVELQPGGARQVIGDLAAGETRRLEIELTADRAGQLQITALASGRGIEITQAQEEVLVRRPELVVRIQGPENCFAGTPAVYRVEVVNRGDAVAEATAVHATLPLGARLVGGENNRNDNTVAWSIGDVAPGARRAFQFECLYSRAGDQPVHVRLTGTGVDPAADSVTTRVEGIADLKLLVNDPQGPQRVSQTASYEVEIVNRGTRAAHNVSVIGQFGPGIEPVKVAGARAELVPGQALFEPIPLIQPGERVVLRIQARASTVGRHKFRAVVQTQSPQTQLVQEEMTWYVSEVATASGTSPR